jgi:ubiquinone biosynthesis protein Coq4
MNRLPSSPNLTLRQGLERYYAQNPTFTQNQDLWVGWLRIPWADLQKHDAMHVVTGYSTDLDQELRLIGFLLTALTWKRPWYFYLQSVGVFIELLGRSLLGRTYGSHYYAPWQVCRFYLEGIKQGRTVRKKIDAYIDLSMVLDRAIATLRAEYGIANAGTWDGGC